MKRGLFATMLAVALPAVAPTAAGAQDPLSRARALYQAADYETALDTLDQMRTSGLVVEDVPEVEQYRALCLLALGRPVEAEEAITAAVTAAPTFSPSGSDVSPRVRTTFADVRRRVLPGVVQRKYAEAKAAFDRKDFAAATNAFAEVLKVLDDPDLAAAAEGSRLADLRTLARGFRELSANAVPSTPPAPPAPAPAAPAALPDLAPAPAAATASESPSRPAPSAPAAPARIYMAGDQGVVPPVTLRQMLPPFPRKVLAPALGVVEVVIDERGLVESAVIHTSIDATYDRLALASARNWRYQPATRGGVPVKYRKLVQVRLQP